MVIFALFVSVVFATLMRDEPVSSSSSLAALRRVHWCRRSDWLAAVPAAAVTSTIMELQGLGIAAGYRFAIIVSRFNEEILRGC